jgi:hypothetical protein
VTPEKKCDVLNLSVLLITDLLQGQKKAKKAEVKGALDVLLPTAISLLGSPGTQALDVVLPTAIAYYVGRKPRVSQGHF